MHKTPTIFISELGVQSDSEEFLSDGVIVNLEWTLLNSQSYYQQFLHNISVTVEPQLNNVIFTENMRVQLTLSYNTLYNVTITQNSVCQTLIRTMSFERIYSRLRVQVYIAVLHDFFF